jgi:hypothetical protein
LQQNPDVKNRGKTTQKRLSTAIAVKKLFAKSGKSFLPDDHDEGWLTSLVLPVSPAEKYPISQFKGKP